MKTMLFKKTILVAWISAITLAAFPLMRVSAAGKMDPIPPAGGIGLSNTGFERIWARMNRRYERIGKFLDKSDVLVGKANKMIELLKEAGEPTIELKAALAAFEDAVKDVHPIYESGKGIINTHKGFDSDGKVTDIEKARETVKDLGVKFGRIRTTMDGTGRELIELMKSIRDAHKPATHNTDA
jgi:hypothetical protein